MSEKLATYNPQGEIVIYQTEDGKASLDVMLENETVWLTQEQMATLYDRDRTVITRHIKNIFAEGELDEKSNVHFLHFPFSDKPVRFYNLDVIIAVGYRVRSQRGTQFRSISADEARAKAIAEYRKYQVRALTLVEQAYYASLKAIEATTKKKK